MIIACPNCHTTYNLSDDKAKPETKMRCTICRQVFTLADSMAVSTARAVDKAEKQPDAEPEAMGDSRRAPETLSIGMDGEKKKQSKLPVFLALTLVIICISVGIMWNKTRIFDPVKLMLGVELPPSPEEIEARRNAKLQEMVGSIGVRNLRQYHVVNEKVGRLMVFEGKVVNEFDEPRELIRVEIELYDDTDTLLLSKSQLAGTMVSFFQLQVLDMAELEQNLNNKLDILSANTNVPPGGTVPFMIVFYTPPENATAFEVKIVDARRPESATQRKAAS